MPSNSAEIRQITFLFTSFEFKELTSHPHGFLKRESPDFVIIANGREIGVELTYGIAEEHARGRALLRNNVKVVSNLKERPKEQRRSSKDVIESALNINASWTTEREYWDNWMGVIRSRVESKRKKLNDSKFTKYDLNWLIVWDDEHAIEPVTQEALLARFFKESPATDFDAIFIYSNPLLWRGANGRIERVKSAENPPLQRRESDGT